MTPTAPDTLAPDVTTQVLEPDDSRRLVPALAGSLHPDVWVYRYEHRPRGWLLSVATNAEPGSGKLSLGGFRIAPESRASQPDYDNDREAIGLAIGMEEKVYWSRVLRVGGPLARQNLQRIVGGKCVLRPTPGARVGEPGDRALLDFAVACLRDVDRRAGIHVTTGQDLGHGTMSDGTTSSLVYMSERFAGSVLADTSKPTGEGNFHLLRGMLAAFGIDLAAARVGLIGAGNIGRHILGRLHEHGTRAWVVEPNAAGRDAAIALGATAWGPERRSELLALPLDAVVVNAAGGSLDRDTVAAIAGNAATRVVCGSENLAMPDPAGERTLLAGGTVYAHTELGGMMGYLTAVEEYLARQANVPFDPATMLDAARRLYDVGLAATRRVIEGGYRETFQEAARA